MQVLVDNKMQTGYVYERTQPPGRIDLGCHDYPFHPAFTPQQMLMLGVFEGKYMNDCREEYGEEMFEHAALSDVPNPTVVNCFKAKSRNPLSYWKIKGWIHKDDPRGWFEWYCRYWMGRRHSDDFRQMNRWRMFAPRHAGAVRAFGQGDLKIRKATRQALLQWSHDPLPDVPFQHPGETVYDKLIRTINKHDKR